MEDDNYTMNTSALVVEMAGLAGQIEMIAKILMEGKSDEEKAYLNDYSTMVRIMFQLDVFAPSLDNERNELLEELKANLKAVKARLDAYNAAKKQKEEE